MAYVFTDSVPYLLNRVGVALGERFSAEIRAHDVTLPMYRVLASLRQSGAATLGELSELVTVEMSTLSRLIGTMDRRGFVSRIRPAGNGRIVQISLTDTGGTMADELMQIAMRFEDTSIAALNGRQVEDLKATLRSIERQIRDL